MQVGNQLSAMALDAMSGSNHDKKCPSTPPSEVHKQLIDDFKLLLKGIDPDTGPNYLLGTLQAKMH